MTLNQTDAALAVWASARHHAAHGGSGLPPITEITDDVFEALWTGEATDSGKYYDATVSKYRDARPAEIDYDVLSEIEVVERALRHSEAPEWFVRYLLFKHPLAGRFVPSRKYKRTTDPDDPPRAFVECGHMERVRSKELVRAQIADVRRAEREFTALLAREIANLPTTAFSGPALCVRWDSPERLETA